MMQLAPAASEAGHVFVCVKGPLAAMLVIDTLTPAVFFSEMVCVLATPTKVPLPKTTLGGLAESAGLTVSIPMAEVEPVEAVTVTGVWLVTAPAVTANV
jgi:hypothetical protein